LEFDIVLATRNRKNVLKISIPLMLNQDRHPHSFIIVDSSDHHEDIKESTESIFRHFNFSGNLQILRSEAGAALQRNIGLKLATSPVAIFPDDDSLWFPGVASAIMKIYERDTNGTIGGVCAANSLVPPPEIQSSGKIQRQMAPKDRLRLFQEHAKVLKKLESRVFPDPFYIEGFRRLGGKNIPGWIQEENATVAKNMEGCRMSFRTEIIRKIKFDEALGIYSMFEDRDASLGTLKDYLLVVAEKAKVFHFRSPEARIGGMEWGVLNILNRAYIVCKHSPLRSLARRRLRRFSYYKIFRYLLQAENLYRRRVLKGGIKALSQLSRIMDAPQKELLNNYLRTKNELLLNKES
jgi:glycosyltransferase involved in cell wall biosynthesis